MQRERYSCQEHESLNPISETLNERGDTPIWVRDKDNANCNPKAYNACYHYSDEPSLNDKGFLMHGIGHSEITVR